MLGDPRTRCPQGRHLPVPSPSQVPPSSSPHTHPFDAGLCRGVTTAGLDWSGEGSEPVWGRGVTAHIDPLPLTPALPFI